MMIRSVALLLVSLSFACGPDGSIGEPQDAGDGGGEVVAEVVVAEVVVSPAGVELVEGESVQLEAVALDANGRAIDAELYWSSDDESIATVEPSGFIRALREGSATITASSADKEGSAEVEVRRVQPASVEISVPPGYLMDGTVRMRVDHELQLQATARDKDGEELTGHTIEWSVDPIEEVIFGTIDSTGLLRATRPGAFKVKAAIGSVSTELDIEATLRFREVSPGNVATCAISTGGKAWCWGKNDKGQLGLGTDAPGAAQTPQPVAGNHSFLTISVGSHHGCAIDTEGQPWCWGTESQGEISGQRPISPSLSTEPVRVLSTVSSRMFAIAARGDSTCALTEGNELACWGGWTGSGAMVIAFGPSTSPLGQLAFGNKGDFLCLRRGEGNEASLWCVGKNDLEQVQSPWTSEPLGWTQRGSDSHRGFTSIAAGPSHACTSFLYTGTARTLCWGGGSWGQTGSSDFPISSDNVWLPTSQTMTQVIAGKLYTCGLRSGNAYCWGDSRYGRAGEDYSFAPIEVQSDVKFSSLAGGENHVCALSVGADPILYCWGHSTSNGALGTGATTFKDIPEEVLGQNLAR